MWQRDNLERLGKHDDSLILPGFCCTVGEHLTYLKKQEEPVVDKEGMYYYLGGKFIYCGYPATKENPYDFAMGQQEKQKEHKPNFDTHWENDSMVCEQKEQKLEWSEEDELMRKRCIADLGYLTEYEPQYKERYDAQIAWLKSLRPSWKPSEEQMEALERSIDYLDESDNDDFGIMLTLYEQLEAL